MEHNFDRSNERMATAIQLVSTSADAREQLKAEYHKRSDAAFAPETLRNFRQITAMFCSWCREKGYDAAPPVDPKAVAAYVDYLGGKVRSTAIGVRLWAISEMHRAQFQPSTCNHRLVELAVKAVKRKYGAAVRLAPPLGKKEMIETIQKLGSSRLELRDKAVLWVATDSGCRASKIVAFKVKDLVRQDDGSSLLYVSRSKTDPYGEGAYSFLSEAGTEAVLRWIETAGLESSDPIITKSQPNSQIRHMDPATISRILKRCTGRSEVSAHSTRVGGVQDAFRLRCDLSSIMVAGRWSSPEMPDRYGRRIMASQSTSAQVSAAFSKSR
ncbi:tyrosine-type recombinase/integrase [Roseovarius arcticus]|uniref:tyrosine-type recombinase/integrase n=1 Tax=Roseovarius arcticus TaxID=2547404 RepID=UPI001110D1F6|nr:tyrosine-type recombinase/integrase [Roseovarius arcticus]